MEFHSGVLLPDYVWNVLGYPCSSKIIPLRTHIVYVFFVTCFLTVVVEILALFIVNFVFSPCVSRTTSMLGNHGNFVNLKIHYSHIEVLPQRSSVGLKYQTRLKPPQQSAWVALDFEPDVYEDRNDTVQYSVGAVLRVCPERTHRFAPTTKNYLCNLHKE